MELQVKLEVFDGPLDLLLHLIEKNKVDIFDIPIVLITEQYLDYVRKMDTKDMDVMSEFHLFCHLSKCTLFLALPIYNTLFRLILASDFYDAYLRAVKKTKFNMVKSHPPAEYHLFPVFLKLTGIILWKKSKARRNHAANPRQPHNAAMDMSAYRKVSSPFRITFKIFRIMCKQN